jgi:replicative DNA helicase
VPCIWGRGEEVAWSSGEPLLLAAPAGVGKTTLAGQLALARLGQRDTVLGMPVERGTGRVLYLACDRPAQIQRSFARMVTEADRELLNKQLVIWKGPPPGDFARHPALLLEMCEAADADTVVIDSLKDVALKLSDDEVGAALNQAHQRAVAAGVEVLGLHHQRKKSADHTKPTKLDDLYGSVWIPAGAGSVLLLWGEAGDVIVELTHIKQPAEPVGPLKVMHDHVTGTSTVFDQTDLLELIRRAAGYGGMTAADAARLLFEISKRQPTVNEVERARRKLDRLVSAGLVYCKPGDRGGGPNRTPSRYYPIEAKGAP